MTEWIARNDALRDALAAAPMTIGLDTEFMRIDTFWPRLALVQIELDGGAALIDPLADIDSSPLAALLGDANRVIIMHSASEDIEALATWRCSVARLFDTQIAAAFAGFGAGLGYQTLVRALLDIDVPKGETRSDWLRRPLSPQQVEYAAQDVMHLPALRQALAAQIEQRGFSRWFDEDCARLLNRARRREADEEPQLGMRGAADWPRERQGLLRRVLRWRDATARSIDRPRPWLLDDAHALDLCAQPPATPDELTARTKGQRALRSEQRQALFDVLSASLENEELNFAPIPRAPSPQQKKVVTAMKDIVAERARALDLPEGLLCARRHLETLLATRHWPAMLEGWRREVLHDALLPLLPD